MSGVGAAIGSVVGGPVGTIVGGAAGPGGPWKNNPFYRENQRFFVDPGDKPEYAKFENIRDPNTGLLKSEALRMQVGQLGPGYQAFEQRALAAPGTSAWEQMAKGQQALEEQTLKQRAIESGAARAAEARGSLARRGGLTGGARERMARGSMRDILMAQQGVGAEGARARGDIGLQAEQQRLQALGQLPGMEASRRGEETGAQQFNITQALQQKQMEEAAKLAEYQEKMRAYAAAQQANAIAAAGPRTGGLFGESGPLGGILG